MVLVVSVVLAAVVLAVASYTTTTLRYGTVVEARADRLAAAEAAMRDALERLRVVDELCTTGVGAGQPINPSFPQINGVDVTVECSTVDGAVPPVDSWAIVVTGENLSGGTRTGYTFDTSGGGNPTIEGPVFVHNPTKVNFKDTTIKSGSLWHTGSESCTGAPVGAPTLEFGASEESISGLSFDPDERKLYCVNRTWGQLFDVRPPTDHVAGMAAAVPVDDTSFPGCRVFSPGRYAYTIPLGSNNYFRSGDYLFYKVDFSTGDNTSVTIGTVEAAVDPVYPLIPLSAPCEVARQADADKSGATLYLSESSRVDIGANSHVEISGRRQGDFMVAVQALDSSTAEPLWSVGSGSNKETAISGLIWAPRSRFVVGAVAGVKDAAFRGGIVVGAFEGTISNAPDTGFLITNSNSEARARLLLESIAVDERGTTVIRVMAEYRRSTSDVAVRSWRVCPDTCD